MHIHKRLTRRQEDNIKIEVDCADINQREMPLEKA